MTSVHVPEIRVRLCMCISEMTLECANWSRCAKIEPVHYFSFDHRTLGKHKCVVTYCELVIKRGYQPLRMAVRDIYGYALDQSSIVAHWQYFWN